MSESVEPFQKGDMKYALTEESTFSVMFPHYREKYLTENWDKIKDKMDSYGIYVDANYKDGIMTVKTTDKTWDPYAIINARDCISLLARSVDCEHAFRIFDDGVESAIIIIGKHIKNQERFVKRRQRLIGPNGSTLKALELLTQCYIMVQGHTVAVIGNSKGVREVEKVVLDCMDNIHPVYHIKLLMTKRELAKNPEMANEDWSRFLPKIKKSTKQQKKKKPHKERNRGLPEYPKDTEIDRQIESGEYFLKEKTRGKRRPSKKAAEATEQAPEAPKAPAEIPLRTVSEAAAQDGQ